MRGGDPAYQKDYSARFDQDAYSGCLPRHKHERVWGKLVGIKLQILLIVRRGPSGIVVCSGHDTRTCLQSIVRIIHHAVAGQEDLRYLPERNADGKWGVGRTMTLIRPCECTARSASVLQGLRIRGWVQLAGGIPRVCSIRLKQ